MVRSHSKNTIMKIYLKKLLLGQVILIFALACFGLSPIARAVTPTGDGGYPNQNTAAGEDALFNLTTGSDNTATWFDALYSNTIGSHNAPASRNWTPTGSLNTGRYFHT